MDTERGGGYIEEERGLDVWASLVFQCMLVVAAGAALILCVNTSF
jgi:hypothetical protein